MAWRKLGTIIRHESVWYPKLRKMFLQLLSHFFYIMLLIAVCPPPRNCCSISVHAVNTVGGHVLRLKTSRHQLYSPSSGCMVHCAIVGSPAAALSQMFFQLRLGFSSRVASLPQLCRGSTSSSMCFSPGSCPSCSRDTSAQYTCLGQLQSSCLPCLHWLLLRGLTARNLSWFDCIRPITCDVTAPNIGIAQPSSTYNNKLCFVAQTILGILD